MLFSVKVNSVFMMASWKNQPVLWKSLELAKVTMDCQHKREEIKRNGGGGVLYFAEWIQVNVTTMYLYMQNVS